jgi:hypothetical protein
VLAAASLAAAHRSPLRGIAPLHPLTRASSLRAAALYTQEKDIKNVGVENFLPLHKMYF